jgi:hypothetical protein
MRVGIAVTKHGTVESFTEYSPAVAAQDIVQDVYLNF